MTTRQLICSVLGHIDHGKSTILDKIRGTAVQSREAGGITQHIGASEVPLESIKCVCGSLLKNELTIPGLLFIDTPGHKAFSSLRERGGSIADIAILVLDVMSPLQPQAIESIEILKKARVPFVIALNKIDTIGGWVIQKGKLLLQDIKSQSSDVQGKLEERLYSLVNELNNYGINAERFDRIKDFTKEISIVPTSGVTGEGIPELLAVLMGLAQRYLESNLEINLDKPAEGSILEVKELKGLGTTLDAIIYDGTLREGDILIIGGLDEPIKSKVRALLKPAPLQEMREKGEFNNVKEVKAASGVKISGPNLDKAISGMPLIACWSEGEVPLAERKVQEMVRSIVFKTEKEGLIIKADSLGSLEALSQLFSDYPIKKAVIGNVTKSDVIEAISVRDKRPQLGVIISFNVKVLPEASELIKESKISVFSGDIIYGLKDQYEEYRVKVELEEKRKALIGVVLPAKVRVLPDNVFRMSNPAIIGIEVISGTIRTGYPLINERGREVGYVKSIRKGEEVLTEGVKGDSVAISVDGGIVGRNITAGGLLYSGVSEQDFHKMKTGLKKYLKTDEVEAMREILKLHRELNPMWGF